MCPGGFILALRSADLLRLRRAAGRVVRGRGRREAARGGTGGSARGRGHRGGSRRCGGHDRSSSPHGNHSPRRHCTWPAAAPVSRKSPDGMLGMG
jgi:hypothetical protein